jgi:hypothetical protein
MSFAEALLNETGPQAPAPRAGEQRKLQRNRVLLAAKFVHGDQKQFTTECTIRNLTAEGASVRMESSLPLPPELGLIETRTGRAHRARIVWRRGGFIGLAFTYSEELRSAPPADPLRRLWAVNQLR